MFRSHKNAVENPFSPPMRTCDIPESKRIRYVDWIAWLGMVPYIAAIYTCWVIAYATLGRPPLLNRDLVSDIDGSFMAVSVAAMDFFAHYTVPFIGIAVLFQLILPGPPFLTRCKRVAATLCATVLSFGFLALDPSGAYRWLVFS